MKFILPAVIAFIGSGILVQASEDLAERKYSVTLQIERSGKFLGGGLYLRLNGNCRVLTNRHNVEQASEIWVRRRAMLSSAEVESQPDAIDLAVLKLNESLGEECLPLADLIPDEKRSVSGKSPWLARGYGYSSGDPTRTQPELFSLNFLGARFRVNETIYWRLGQTIRKGMSGSPLFVEGLPVGIITENQTPANGSAKYGAVITNTMILRWLEKGGFIATSELDL